MALDLRNWISALEENNLLNRVDKETDIRDCSRLISDHYEKASYFERVAGYDIPIVANSVSSREMMALALGTNPKDVLNEYLRRIENPIPPKFSSSDGDCQEQTYEEVDLTTLPILLQHEYDGGPYISAGVVIAKDPDTAEYNIGIYRLMFRKKDELGINITAPHRLRWFYQKAFDKGKPLEVAICLGLHAVDLLASVTSVPEGKDELAIWGGLRKTGVKLVKCKTIDLHVAAHAEFVLEARMDPIGWIEPEGPYGEFPGTYSGMRKNPVVKVQAVTSRHNPIYQSATHGGRHLANSDFFVIIPQIELSIYQALKHAGIDARAVRILPSSAGMICYLSISQRIKGDSRNALHVALSGSKQNFPKYCVVVDNDIDIFDDNEVQWAISTRSQPKEDVIILENMRIPSSSDPSLVGPPFSMSKLGLDATIPTESNRSKFEYSRPPAFEFGKMSEEGRHAKREKSSDIGEEMKKLLRTSGPLFFYDVAKKFVARDYKSILLAWSLLREENVLEQLPDGKYLLREESKK